MGRCSTPPTCLDRIVNEAGVAVRPACTRPPTSTPTRNSPRGPLPLEHEDEVHGTVTVPGVVPKLSGTPGARSAQPARWTVGAATPRPSSASSASARRTSCWAGLRGGGRVSLDLRRRAARRAPERRRHAGADTSAPSCATGWPPPGCPVLEAASFVDPGRVPQMAGAEEVFARLAAGQRRRLTRALVLTGAASIAPRPREARRGPHRRIR